MGLLNLNLGYEEFRIIVHTGTRKSGGTDSVVYFSFFFFVGVVGGVGVWHCGVWQDWRTFPKACYSGLRISVLEDSL